MNNKDEMKRLLEATIGEPRRYGSTTFGANYNPDFRYTDANAPSPGDTVLTPDGRGIVIDSSQNNDGYYVFFEIDLATDADEHDVRRYHISAVKKYHA